MQMPKPIGSPDSAASATGDFRRPSIPPEQPDGPLLPVRQPGFLSDPASAQGHPVSFSARIPVFGWSTGNPGPSSHRTPFLRWAGGGSHADRANMTYNAVAAAESGFGFQAPLPEADAEDFAAGQIRESLRLLSGSGRDHHRPRAPRRRPSPAATAVLNQEPITQ